MKHINCGGSLALSSNSLRMISPGMKLTTGGIIPGVIEINAIGESSHEYLCTKCGKTFKTSEDLEEIEETCMCCNDEKKVKEILVTTYGIFCIECFTPLCKESTDVCDQYMQGLKEILSVSNRSPKANLAELMLKPIKF